MNLIEAWEAFPDVARPIVIKSDVCRLGLSFSRAARRALMKRTDIIFKGYWLFSFDRGERVMFSDKIPYMFWLEDGTEEGTPIQVRQYEHSPYNIGLMDGTFMLFWEKLPLGKVYFDRLPKFWRRTVNGVPMASIIQAVGDQLFVALNKYCEYFSWDRQCLYCDLTTFAQEQKKEGEVMIPRKRIEQVVETLDVATHEHRFRHMHFTGGSFTKYQGQSEVDWYCHFLNAVRGRFRGWWWGASIQVGAQDDEGWRKLRDTGIPTVQPNIEVWDKRLFEIICPGKAQKVGYDKWIKRTLKAVDFWGAGNVCPSFVAGVEMAQPFGFKTIDEALESTLGGYDLLMNHGLLPRQGSFWIVESDSKLAGHEPVPLEYFIRLGKGYLELREKYHFSSPPNFRCRYCATHDTEYDFEYWHGKGPSSRKAEQQDATFGSAAD